MCEGDKMKRVYISGAVTGLPFEEALGAFDERQRELEVSGYEAVNPVRRAEVDVAEGSPWEEYMAYDLELLATCEAISFLPGWEDSRGARLEAAVAKRLGLEVVQ